MKKVLLLGFAAMATFALTGCDAIKSFISGEKSYTYNDYKALLADRKLAFTNTKATSTTDKDGKKTERNYTYDKDDKEWKYTYKTTVLGEEIDMDGSTQLDIVSEIKTFDLTCALLNKKADDIFKFYAKNDSYRITGEYKTDDVQISLEYKYRADGLVTNKFEKSTNLNSVTTTETTITFTYSD